MFVEGDESAVGAEALRQREADDDAGEDFLAGGAAAAHVHFRVLLHHDHSVVVGPVAFCFVVADDADRVHVGALVCIAPELGDDAVDFFHLDGVVLDDSLVERGSVAA